jgi:hypothetical protein
MVRGVGIQRQPMTEAVQLFRVVAQWCIRGDERLAVLD